MKRYLIGLAAFARGRQRNRRLRGARAGTGRERHSGDRHVLRKTIVDPYRWMEPTPQSPDFSHS